MSDICDCCKQEKKEVFYKEIINSSGETVDVFLCANCYGIKADSIDLRKIGEKKKNDLNIRLLYDEMIKISDKLSKIILLLEKE